MQEVDTASNTTQDTVSSQVSTTTQDTVSSNTADLSMDHYCIEPPAATQQVPLLQTELPMEESRDVTELNNEEDDEDDDDKTLIVDDDGNEDYVMELPCEQDMVTIKIPENMVVSSPSPMPPIGAEDQSEAVTGMDSKSSLGRIRTAQERQVLDIVSVNSDMSDMDDTIAPDEEDEDDSSRAASRAKRIEELAMKMLAEDHSGADTGQQQGSRGRTRHPSDPGIRNLYDILGELDTVSERSEMEEGDAASTAAVGVAAEEESESSESDSCSENTSREAISING